jgi:hypothetical protein
MYRVTTLFRSGAEYFKTFRQGTQGQGWQSFDHSGTLYRLNNVWRQPRGRLRVLLRTATRARCYGRNSSPGLKRRSELEQAPRSSFSPRSARPYPQWGWERKIPSRHFLSQKFGSVTVLNGHIHPGHAKVEGNVTFTAFDCDPQPASALHRPLPMKDAPAGQLGKMIGVTRSDICGRTSPWRLLTRLA